MRVLAARARRRRRRFEASTRAAMNRGVAGQPGDRPLGARRVVVGDDHVLEEVAPRGDRDDRAADAARADDEDPHAVTSGPCESRASGSRWRSERQPAWPYRQWIVPV